MKNLKFRLVFEGEVSPDGEGDPDAQGLSMTAEELQGQLEEVIKNALRNGIITGDTPAILLDHETAITIQEA